MNTITPKLSLNQINPDLLQDLTDKQASTLGGGVVALTLIFAKADENISSQPFMRWRDRFL